LLCDADGTRNGDTREAVNFVKSVGELADLPDELILENLNTSSHLDIPFLDYVS